MSEAMDHAELQRAVRAVAILDAAEHAGLVPLPVLRLHTIAFFSNVLSPVWNMPVLQGSLFKRRGGPFYPPLQRDLDRLTGRGVVIVSNLGHVRDETGNWRLEGSYRLNRTFADPILAAISLFPAEERLHDFVSELVLAVSGLDDTELDRATEQDATYGDPLVPFGSVVDFAQWRNANYTANAANEVGRLLPGGAAATAGERLHLYVRHLHKRLAGGR